MAVHICDQCGTTFKRQGSRPYRFCSHACRVLGLRGQIRVPNVKGRMRWAVGHPLTPPSGILAVSRLVLYDKIGPGTHPCHWCGTPVTWAIGVGPMNGTIIADHLNFDRADDSPENLVPACTACNAHRTRQGDRSRLADGELTLTLANGTRTRAVERHCEKCGTAFLTIPAAIRQGKGRFCSRSCARKK